MRLKTKIDIMVAVFAGVAALGIWYYLIRPVPELHQDGVIEEIEFAKKQRVERSEPGKVTSYSKQTSYTLPDRFTYIIKLADGKTARYEEISVGRNPKSEYKIGQKLNVTYRLRELPFGKEKLLVLDVKLL